ncbi:unnamed protein product [Caenorhabditis sp. 36 PRJEB53466]|nr:unnamed protein product [Caenorhabditis sp. 36 PRJEB53466]
MLGTCREKNRKILRIKVRTSNETIVFKIGDQLFRRPYDPSQDQFRVLIPQSVPCCLIRALYLSNSDLKAYSSASTVYENSMLRVTGGARATFPYQKIEPTSVIPPTTSLGTEFTFNYTNQWSKFTLGKNPTVSSTSKPKPRGSWTHAVNKEWSITFVLCSIVICTIMLFLAVFGTFTVFYLMTKPSGGKSPFAVDA